MTRRSASFSGAIAVAGLVVALAACSTGGPASTAAPLPTAATATRVATAVPATPTIAATQGPVAIPEGVYSTGPRSIADVRAEVEANHDPTDAERKTLFDELFEFGDGKTFVVTITLENGQWVQRQGVDDEPLGIGSRATYAFPDDRTVVIQEACCGISSFDVAMTGDSFRLKYASDPSTGTVDRLAGHILFEKAPFIRVP